MSTLKINITATATVRYSKTVEMEEADYKRYLTICDSDLSSREIDQEVTELAIKYGFEPCDDQIEDINDPEDIEFDVIN
ncbi:MULTISPECIES: hypothetical protein [unclassified Serratia (in: enterobacteria)]|uniref:hypothetical protein n=1 Tax=unclassified Serratia (in: enterobacteria) TaxID=2647522 RepID=UPI000501C65D|nr:MULTISPECIES: hypothetical protein [unclassified Serratia (in: enterobacteria)]KFK92754.1 hypothetical protein JV45_19610 [Serratia sp. Ag2]KFK96525.1 hypothetical protein IV04_18305 [Serratia sp. Ag1]